MLYTFEYDSSYTPSIPVAEIRIGRRNSTPSLVLPAIIDSGADATIIPARWLYQIQARRSESAWMNTAAGTRRIVSLYVISLRIGPYEQRALSVIAGLDSEEALIGRDVLNHLIVTLNGLASVTEIAQ